LVDCLTQELEVHLVNIHGAANSLQHRERQSTAEMLPEFFQSSQQLRRIGELRMIQGKTQVGKALSYTRGIQGLKSQGKTSISGIDRNANGHRLAVPKREVRHGL
jgi:hypothetical protein